MEDCKGDTETGRKTLPVVSGMKTSKLTVILLSLVTLFLFYMVWYRFLHDTITLVYISVMLSLPMVVMIAMIVRAKERNHFHKASSLMKFIMLTGILYSLVAGAIITSGKLL